MINELFNIIGLSSPLIIEGALNFFIINIVKYICLISFIFLSIVIIVKKLKHKKINKILIILTTIFLIISFLAFCTDIYDDTMRTFLPYTYGV